MNEYGIYMVCMLGMRAFVPQSWMFNHNHHQPINVPTAGAQAFPRDGIGRLDHDPPRGPSADWRVLTTADAAGPNGLTSLPKHGGTRDGRFLEDHIYYGIGTSQKWRRLTRDLIIDMQKGWALLDRPKRKSPRTKFKISSLILSGAGSADNFTVSGSEHTAQFLAAATWLTAHQRQTDGGWAVPVRRRIPGVTDLRPGWHSAMSQGHAISVLSRAYHRTGDVLYLSAAKKALFLLDVPSAEGGVKAMWMDKYVWYEEYPTKPPLFVLNGFIYTLLGLYDLHVIEGENSISLAKKMFDDGMTSLKTLLPLFDTGSGSFYDLRHFTLGVSPNIARWDYHATHVNQLYLLAGMDDDPILINTAKRWEGYMQGKRAAHN
ncbi:hypothetical protein evm_014423 [Chilo suppressalis]|nr:hypothetical protein evm_014423 [Chilo suppressalis]